MDNVSRITPRIRAVLALATWTVAAVVSVVNVAALAQLADAGAGREGGGSGSSAAAGDHAGADAGPAVGFDRASDGLYRLVDPQSVDAAQNASVEAAIASLHPSMRDTFRAQLRASLRAPRRIRIAHVSDAVVVTFDDTEFRAPLAGAPVAQRGIEGRVVNVTHREHDGVLVQEVRNGQFRRSDTLSTTAAGIHVEVELRSGLLPRPLTSRATYARAHAESVDGGSSP